MGGFANVLGNAAAGFEQARQQDLTRQFTDEQNRRAMAGELMGKIIMDANQPAEVRTAFTQAYLGMSNQPFNKPFNFQKQIGPLFDLMAKYRGTAQQQPPQVATPPAPPGLAAPAAQAQPAAVPPSAFPGASMLPQASVPPPPPPPAGQPDMAPTSQATRGSTMAAAAGGPPTPEQAGAPQEFLAGHETLARNLAMMKEAEASGTLGGQIKARHEYLNQIPGLTPELRAVLGLGGSVYPFVRQVGSGGGYAKDLRAQGYDVPPAIKDDQWVDMKQLAGGQYTFNPAKAPGEVAGGGGTLVTPVQAYQQKLAAEMPYFTKKLGMRFTNQLTLQNNAFALAVQRGTLGDANQIFFKAQDDYGKRLSALDLMQRNYQEALKGNQQAQVSMLMQHIGMTAGTVPGSRMARATIEEAEQSTPWIAHTIAKWFHQDAAGDYIFDGPKGGVNLTKPQMEQMLSLGKERVQVQHEQLDYWQKELVPGQGEFTAPGITAIRGTPQATPQVAKGAGRAAKPAATAGAPPPPPKESRPPLSSFEH